MCAPQKQKAVSQVATVLSVPIPAQGGIVDVFTHWQHGQSYVRDIQKVLVPRVIT
jgi:hypothetical protein